MSDFKFACPDCDQHIQCDEQLGGQPIKCPACQADLVVPQLQPKPSVRVAVTPVRTASPAPLAASSPVPRRSAPVEGAESGGGRVKQMVKVTVVVLLLGVGGYFGLPALLSMQREFNAKQEKANAEHGGGEVGHALELNQVLEATDMERKGDPEDTPARKARRAARAARAESAPPVEPELPVIAPSYNLETPPPAIPASKVNGKISGVITVAATARLGINGAVHTLSLREGTNFIADHEIQVFLRLKPGETIEGHTWTVTKDMGAGSVPQVAKRWKTDPKFAPQQKIFNNGYAMKLEFGTKSEDYAKGETLLPGKIYVALPDTEQSVVAGVFKASVRVTDPAAGKMKTGRPSVTFDGDE